jgi:hypothetical protein
MKNNTTERRYMKMKISTLMVLVALGVMVFAMPFALAEDAAVTAASTASDDTLSSDPGTTPDSAMYGLKLGWEKVGLLFTFNQEKKAQKELALAEKRLLEVKKMAEKGNLKAMEKAQEKHDALVESAQARLEKLQEDSKEAQIRETATKVIGLEVALKAHENRIEVLKDILAEKNLSDEARTAIDAAVAKMENKTSAMAQKIEERKDNIKIRLRAVTEKTETEVESEVASIENSSGLIAAEKAIAEKRVAKTEDALAKLKERVSEEKFKAVNVSIIETRIAEAEQRVADAKVLIEQGKYADAIAVLKPVSNFGRNLSFVVKKINQARIENHKEEIKNLIAESKELKEKQLELREDLKNKIADARNASNLGAEVRNEIKNAITNRLSR